MPIHDWTKVDLGLFHSFHQQWIGNLCAAFNKGKLPAEYFALAEQNVRGPIPDVLALHLKPDETEERNGGVAIATAPPRTRLVRRSESSIYADKADIITIRHRHGDVVAVIEIVSPGNKGSKAEFTAFVQKSAGLIRQKVHLLVIDLFPPTARDPQGIHKAIWDEFEEEDFEVPSNQPLTLASYDAGPPRVAYVENIAPGESLPEMPLFLRPEAHVPTPLEATYQITWDEFPRQLKRLLT